MGVETKVNIGWIPVLRRDLVAWQVCEAVGVPDDYIIGTDYITGKQNHVCLFNHTDDSAHYDLNKTGIVRFDTEPKPLTESATAFVQAVKTKFGENSIMLVYGARQWYC